VVRWELINGLVVDSCLVAMAIDASTNAGSDLSKATQLLAFGESSSPKAVGNTRGQNSLSTNKSYC
jgi:hypothetical protein